MQLLRIEGMSYDRGMIRGGLVANRAEPIVIVEVLAGWREGFAAHG